MKVPEIQMKKASGTFKIQSRIVNFSTQMAFTSIHRLHLLVLVLVCGSLQVQGQLISTHQSLGAKAQIMLHLDQLEASWEVKLARKEQAKKGSAPGVETESAIPGDMQMSLQLKAIQGEMEFELLPGVKDFVRLYARRKRSATEAMMGLQAIYFPNIEQKLAENGMPDNLKYLAVAMSCLNARAVSDQGTAGLWQLPFHAAVRHGLTCNESIDERRDPAKSSAAALSYLKTLHEQYGDWTMAMTAFTCGAGGVQKAWNRAGKTNDFEKLYPYLPEANRDYVPAFMAAAYVMRYHQLFGMQALEINPAPRKDILQLSEPIAFAPVSRVLRIPEDELRAYNPTCRLAVIPFTGKTVQICLPAGYGARFSQLKDSIYALQKRDAAAIEPTPKPEVTAKNAADSKKPLPTAEPPANSAPLQYAIQRGDNLGSISRWFGVKVAELKAWNGLENDNIRAGDVLTLHVPKAEVDQRRRIVRMSFEEKEALGGKLPSANAPVPETKPDPTAKKKVYTVKQGDSLWAISQKYPGISPEDIMRENGITDKLQPGMKLKIPTPAQ